MTTNLFQRLREMLPLPPFAVGMTLGSATGTPVSAIDRVRGAYQP